MAITPFSPSIVSGVGWWQSEHDTSVFCSLAHLVTHPSQKVWPHSKSKGMRFPIGLVTSEEWICNIIFMLIIQEKFLIMHWSFVKKKCIVYKTKRESFHFCHRLQIVSVYPLKTFTKKVLTSMIAYSVSQLVPTKWQHQTVIPVPPLPLGLQIHPSPLQFQLAREATHFTL